MLKVVVPSLALILASFVAVSAAEKSTELDSGLKPGAFVPAFNVRDITGPQKGKTLCYRCRYGGKPVVNIFAREITPELTALIKNVDKQVGENKDKRMSAFVVFLSDDADTIEPKIKALAKKHKLTIPLTIIEDVAGPEEYKISKDADITVMMWVESEVKVNHAFGKGKLKKENVKKVAAETKKILED
jgi:hypothetical protein